MATGYENEYGWYDEPVGTLYIWNENECLPLWQKLITFIIDEW